MTKTFYELFESGDFVDEFKTLEEAKQAAQNMEPDYLCAWMTDKRDENIIWGSTKHLGFMILVYESNYSTIEIQLYNKKYTMRYIREHFPEVPPEDWIACESISLGGWTGPYVQFFQHWQNRYSPNSSEYLLRKIVEQQREEINLLKQALDSLKK